MHIFFAGIGGVGIGPLARITKQLGYEVSGTDALDSKYISRLKADGISVSISKGVNGLEEINAQSPVDWIVYSSALPLSDPNHPILEFAKNNDIKASKRDAFLSEILAAKKLKLLAIAGTHGKTTTTAMCVWLFKQLELPLAYSVGGGIPFGPMGNYDEGADWFIYEADEFDRNFLAYNPELAAISGVAYDHHEIYKTEAEYMAAFRQFYEQSKNVISFEKDIKTVFGESLDSTIPENIQQPQIDPSLIKLAGIVNRLDAAIAVAAVQQATGADESALVEAVNNFPGVSRRFETIIENLISDYAHTPDKITGALETASELASETNQKIVIIYEPLTNRRQHYVKDAYKGLFEGVDKLYWLPSFMAREDPNLAVLSPTDLIKTMANSDIADPADLNEDLKTAIANHLEAGDLVVALTGGGANSLDSWLRQEFKN